MEMEGILCILPISNNLSGCDVQIRYLVDHMGMCMFPEGKTWRYRGVVEDHSSGSSSLSSSPILKNVFFISIATILRRVRIRYGTAAA